MPMSSVPSTPLPLDLILVNRDSRQRREFTTEDLELTMRVRGLINPIVVRDLGDGTFELVAGERRLTTARKLGWESIECRFVDALSKLELELIELEENIKRKDLPWQDQLAAISRIHEYYTGQDEDWTQNQTAEAIGLSAPQISHFLTVSEAAKTKPELLAKPKMREAYNVIKRHEARKLGNDFEQLFGDIKTALLDPAETQVLERQQESQEQARQQEKERLGEEILCESFLDWAPRYDGKKFNLIHCDFPYGVELFAKEFGQRGGAKPYTDSKDTYFALLNCLLDNLERVFSQSGHLLFWYSMKYDRETKDLFATKAPSLDFSTHPLIWGKSDNTGIIGDARRDFRHTYEVALLARRGARQVVKLVADFYPAPTDRTLHPSAKPEPMLRHFLSGLVDEHTSLLDPTCGAGSALRAAESLGATRILGLEIDSDYCEAARTALRNFRLMRKATMMQQQGGL